MRRKFAVQYGFVVPEIKVSDISHRAAEMLPVQDSRGHRRHAGRAHRRISGDQRRRQAPRHARRGDARTRLRHEGLVHREAFAPEARRLGFNPIDNMSVLLTHLSEVIRNNLAQMLSYKDMRALFDRLGPEYKRLLDEISPSQISYSGLQAVLKLLLAERISIRNLHLILEAIAEIAPHARRAEQIAEHVRVRMAQQICGDLAQGGVLKILRLGNRWDMVFHQSLKRDAKGDVTEFDIDPRLVEEFGADASKVIRKYMDARRTVRAGGDAGNPPLCAHDRRAPVRHAAGAVASGTRARHRDQVAGNDRVISTLVATAPAMIATIFVLFCRIGACLMVAPGFSSARTPVPREAVHRGDAEPRAGAGAHRRQAAGARRQALDGQSGRARRTIFSELLIGGFIGMLGRLFFLALETMMMAASMNIGMSNALGAPVDELESLPAIASLVSVTVTCLIFIMGLHWELIRGLVASYKVMPVGTLLRPQALLATFATRWRAPSSRRCASRARSSCSGWSPISRSDWSTA